MNTYYEIVQLLLKQDRAAHEIEDARDFKVPCRSPDLTDEQMLATDDMAGIA